MPQQFVVPQFIDAEAKILGPITARQFVILLVTVMIIAITYALVSRTTFFIILVPEAGIGGTIAFIKINGQSFHYFLLNLFQTLRKARLRIWQKNLSDAYLRQFIQKEAPPIVQKFQKKEFVASTRLNELSLIVNTGGSYRPDSDDVL